MSRDASQCASARANGRHRWQPDEEPRRERCTTCDAKCERDTKGTIIEYAHPAILSLDRRDLTAAGSRRAVRARVGERRRE